MTRTEYRTARRLYRDNGTASLRWLTADHAAVMRSIIEAPEDPYGALVFFFFRPFNGRVPTIQQRLAFRYYLQLRKD
jgi:hypothetical protein